MTTARRSNSVSVMWTTPVVRDRALVTSGAFTKSVSRETRHGLTGAQPGRLLFNASRFW